MTKIKKSYTYQVGDDDHSTCPRGTTRRKLYSTLNKEHNAVLDSTKVEISSDVLVDFTAMYSNYHGHIIINTSETIQRVEHLNTEELLTLLRKAI